MRQLSGLKSSDAALEGSPTPSSKAQAMSTSSNHTPTCSEVGSRSEQIGLGANHSADHQMKTAAVVAEMRQNGIPGCSPTSSPTRSQNARRLNCRSIEMLGVRELACSESENQIDQDGSKKFAASE
jgi:hypothetical protein